ncbi:MAG: acyltransferase [Mesorhizobium sp.]|uniref:acyltransferase family protein n=1 Tax=Mesorhizobium sp. TaxID=1871066 RepID=UPI000FE4D796|nr:acyltransferase [Mesorhizobium sp.]RWG80956.1 MAG: acyltransferase [Mesorhizobium sp.]RWK12544.1 MAG: acyltransferase [Mesorhizobium sp.]
MGRDRLYGLDALRGVAAVAVALHHFARINHLPLPPLNPSIAVDLFFILSGFVMTRTYEDQMRDGLTTVGFIGLRYRRLFLPLAIGSTIGLFVMLDRYGVSAPVFAAYGLILCFLPVVGRPAFPLNGPAWSLFVEIVCNVLHGAIFSKISNMQLLVLSVASALVFIACFTTGMSLWSPDFTSVLWLIPREMTCYLVGIWIFRTSGDAPLGNRPTWAICAFALALGLASVNAPLEMLALIVCPLIVRASLGLPRMAWAIWAGAISYPLYATHVPTMQLARYLGAYPFAGLLAAAAVAITVAMIFETGRTMRTAASQVISG